MEQYTARQAVSAREQNVINETPHLPPANINLQQNVDVPTLNLTGADNDNTTAEDNAHRYDNNNITGELNAYRYDNDRSL